MDGRELDVLAKILKIKNWRGIHFADQFPRKIKAKNIYVINCCTSRDANAQGHHWLAVYMKSRSSIELFDSAGVRPRQLKHLRLPHHREIYYSGRRLQNYASNTCGLYCLFYAKIRSDGASDWDFMRRYFSKNLNKNDNFIRNWAKKVLRIS